MLKMLCTMVMVYVYSKAVLKFVTNNITIVSENLVCTNGWFDEDEGLCQCPPEYTGRKCETRKLSFICHLEFI